MYGGVRGRKTSGINYGDPLLPSAGIPLAGGGMSPTLIPDVFIVVGFLLLYTQSKER